MEVFMTVLAEASTSTCTLHYRPNVGHAVSLPKDVKLKAGDEEALRVIGVRVAAELDLVNPIDCRVISGCLGLLVPALVPHESVRKAALKALDAYQNGTS
jgi:hypothetical protein